MDDTAVDSGSAALFYGATLADGGGFTWLDADVTFFGALTRSETGSYVVNLGDRDGDGAGDFAIGASELDLSGTQGQAGGLYLWYGR